jgi:glyoxylase-like metal-dependent hydrolase (beta-lactamase superfamily II)
MQRVNGSLRLASLMRISNAWLFEVGGRKVLVDTGHALERPLLQFSLWRAGIRRKGDLAQVILTHRHSDHAGNAAWLRRTFDCEVACHVADADALSGRSPPPSMANRGGAFHEEVLCRVEDRFPARCEVDEAFAEGPWKQGFRVIHVPGHTQGSAMLHHEPTGTLFAGDAILAGIPPLRFFEYPRLARPGFSDDVLQCHREVLRYLADLPPTDALCSGHGPPITRNTAAKLQRLRQATPGK